MAMQTLFDLPQGAEGVVAEIRGEGKLKLRLAEMGLVRGTQVAARQTAPLGDPRLYVVAGFLLSLRHSEARCVILSGLQKEKREWVVAMAGNPNCGKTALFNRLTGARQRVGNFSGVTVARKEGFVQHKGWTLRFVDLPGIYSLSTLTMEERVTQAYLYSQEYDLVLNVLDAGNLERNLFLTVQLIESGRPRIYALNMADEARNKGIEVDMAAFARLLDGPAVATIARTGEGVDALLDLLVADAEQGSPRRGVTIRYDDHLERAAERLLALTPPVEGVVAEASRRWQAIQLLEGLETALPAAIWTPDCLAAARREREQIAHQHGETTGFLLASGRYGFIRGLLRETVRQVATQRSLATHTDRLDGALLHPLLGLPLFLFFMWLMFQATFTVGKIPTAWINSGFQWLTQGVESWLPASLLREMLTEGVLSGVGSVASFLPNIVLLFLFISLFEDSGYMARAAFLTDRAMHGIGLHGRAFIPLLMGFGCNVPAIMATRTMEHPKDRLVTILINPFMSCSARLPVFILFAGAFFQKNAGLVVFSLYLLGIVAALLTAMLLKKTLFRGISEPFVMELPPYRWPTARSVALHMWEKTSEFLKKMGGIILAGSVLVWFLQAYPREVVLDWSPAEKMAAVEARLPEGAERQVALQAIQSAQAAAEQEQRFLGQMGRAIQPLFQPLGFDWRDSIALLTGFVAKEVVVSTLGVLHGSGGREKDPSGEGLQGRLATAMPPVTAYAFMVFTLLYTPCLATIAVIRRETFGWRWPVLTVLYGLVVAWSAAWLVQWIGRIWS
ncbi:MAG: ferrous iron transport protein B [Magnetococcales bacterium]|nr:ferrous iron transport protein B [Magnetococcales bacterium]